MLLIASGRASMSAGRVSQLDTHFWQLFANVSPYRISSGHEHQIPNTRGFIYIQILCRYHFSKAAVAVIYYSMMLLWEEEKNHPRKKAQNNYGHRHLLVRVRVKSGCDGWVPRGGFPAPARPVTFYGNAGSLKIRYRPK